LRYKAGARQKNPQGALKRLLKFLHTIGAIGFMGSLVTLLVLAERAPPPESLAGYALIRAVMAEIAARIVLPSLALTLVPGILAIAVTRGFHNAGWAWIKAATGILIFMGGLHALAPIQDEARLSAEALAGQLDPATLSGVSGGEIVTIWVLLAVSTVNVVLGVWRPRLTRSARREAANPSEPSTETTG
jgi:hypothetical protein